MDIASQKPKVTEVKAADYGKTFLSFNPNTQ